MKKRLHPTVSVIIPAHNAQEFLAEAIDSILHQTFSDFELIIVNDGSTDQTGKIAQQYAQQDKRVKVISYRQNKGESAAANLGFLKSKGKYIARMDADDIAHSRRLEKQVRFLDKHPNYIVVGSQAHIINEHNQIIGQKLFPTSHQDIYREYGNLHPMLHPSIMVRKSMIPWTGKLWANQAEPNDDYYTLFHFLKAGKFANLPEKLMLYRMHSNNKSMQNIKKKFINSLRIRAYAFRYLGYRPPVITYAKLLIQSTIVLMLPESVTRGLFFVLKGIKPIDQAFPVIGQLKQTFAQSFQPEFALPLVVYALVHSVTKKI